eukprot:gene18625-biopygen17423
MRCAPGPAGTVRTQKVVIWPPKNRGSSGFDPEAVACVPKAEELLATVEFPQKFIFWCCERPNQPQQAPGGSPNQPQRPAGAVRTQKVAIWPPKNRYSGPLAPHQGRIWHPGGTPRKSKFSRFWRILMPAGPLRPPPPRRHSLYLWENDKSCGAGRRPEKWGMGKIEKAAEPRAPKEGNDGRGEMWRRRRCQTGKYKRGGNWEDPTPGTVGDPGAQPDSDSDPLSLGLNAGAKAQPDSDSARAPAAGTQPDPVGLTQPRIGAESAALDIVAFPAVASLRESIWNRRCRKIAQDVVSQGGQAALDWATFGNQESCEHWEKQQRTRPGRARSRFQCPLLPELGVERRCTPKGGRGVPGGVVQTTCAAPQGRPGPFGRKR